MIKIFVLLKNEYFWLGLILVFGLLVRLYKIDSPIADWHSWRQADTAAVTRNFIKEGFNPFIPKYDDISGVSETPIPNPARFRFVEFPIYNIAVYPFYLLFGVDIFYHRLVSVIFSLGSIIFLYFITKRYTNIAVGLISAFTFALLPFNVFFSRTTLPEPTFVFFALGMVYFVDRWIWESADWRIAIWGFVFTAIAFLIKPWAIFFVIPLVYSALEKWKLENGKWKIILKYLIFFIFAITPFLLWRLWILQQPQGIPATSWLFNSDGIRFRPAFFWWIISERMGREILGATGLVLFVIGLVTKPLNGKYFLHIWLASIFLFFIIFATGNVRHDYYQVIFAPVGSIFLALGFVYLLRGDSHFLPRIFTIFLALILFPLAFYFGFKQVSSLYQINNGVIVEAGEEADKILPKDAVVLAPYNGDTAFLYQINRPGWPIVPTSIKELIADYGVTHYVSTTQDPKTAWVLRHFQKVSQKPNYVIVDLQSLTEEFDDKSDPEPR